MKWYASFHTLKYPHDTKRAVMSSHWTPDYFQRSIYITVNLTKIQGKEPHWRPSYQRICSCLVVLDSLLLVGDWGWKKFVWIGEITTKLAANWKSCWSAEGDKLFLTTFFNDLLTFGKRFSCSNLQPIICCLPVKPMLKGLHYPGGRGGAGLPADCS